MLAMTAKGGKKGPRSSDATSAGFPTGGRRTCEVLELLMLEHSGRPGSLDSCATAEFGRIALRRLASPAGQCSFELELVLKVVGEVGGESAASRVQTAVPHDEVPPPVVSTMVG